MVKEGKFGPQEAISLITITIVIRVFFTSPSITTRFVGSAGWYMTLISAATAAAGFTIIYLLIKKFPDKDLIEIYEITLGPYIGSLFSFAVFLIFIIDAGIVLREFTEVMKVYVLPLSPPSYIIGIFVLGVIVLGILGLETQARFARLIAPVLLISFIAGLILAAPNYQVHRIKPVFGYGLGNVVIHGLFRSSVYGYAIIAVIIAKSLQGTKYVKMVGYTSIILSGILISSALLAFSLTFPYYIAQEVTSPLYQMTALIDFGRFFQRLDPLFLFIWNISTLIAVSIQLYISASIYSKIFRIQDIGPIIIPLSIIAFATAMMPKDLESIALGYVNTLREYAWLVYYVPAFIALIAAWLRGKEKRSRRGEGRKRMKKSV
ncbi:MAG TPA: GerAB/ArcD/ProY family transporter [Clostridiales bacterium]|nr:GerAB/ArcD/ProY family transporter [Clostridiales bacterium]